KGKRVTFTARKKRKGKVPKELRPFLFKKGHKGRRHNPSGKMKITYTWVGERALGKAGWAASLYRGGKHVYDGPIRATKTSAKKAVLRESLQRNPTKDPRYATTLIIKKKKNPNYMTKAQFTEYVTDEILPLIAERYEQDGVADRPARREAWNDIVDSMVEDRQLPRKALSWAIPDRLETKRVR